MPNPPVFARDSDAAFFVAYTTNPPDDTLIAHIRDTARITMTITCTYRFDPRHAAAHTTRGADNNPRYGEKETVWKWHEPPTDVLKRRGHSRKGSTEVGKIGSGRTTITKVKGDLTGTTVVDSEAGGDTGNTISRRNSDEKPLPGLPPPTPVDEFGGRISTPIPPGGFKDNREGEKTVILLNTDRIGFPHRAKAKEGQVTPQGLWKGKLNWQWWMMPSLDMAGLSVNVCVPLSTAFPVY